jgi:hypothetical protein
VGDDIGIRDNFPHLAFNLFRHTVTFRDIQLVPFLLRVPRLPSLVGAHTPRLAALDRLATSNATRKIAAAALRAI